MAYNYTLYKWSWIKKQVLPIASSVFFIINNLFMFLTKAVGIHFEMTFTRYFSVFVTLFIHDGPFMENFLFCVLILGEIFLTPFTLFVIIFLGLEAFVNWDAILAIGSLKFGQKKVIISLTGVPNIAWVKLWHRS